MDWKAQVLDTVYGVLEDFPDRSVDGWADAWWTDWDDLFIGPRPTVSYINFRAWVRECIGAWEMENE